MSRIGLLMLILWPMFALGQATAPVPDSIETAEPTRDPLALKQQIVRDRMGQLEERMYRLSTQLQTLEARQAEQLENAVRRTRELLIRREMERTIRMLETGQLGEAAEREQDIVTALEQVLAILTSEPDRTRQLQEQIAKLQEWLKQVEALVAKQNDLKSQLDRAGKQDSLEQTTAEQRALKDDTSKLADSMGPRTPKKEAEDQAGPDEPGDSGDKSDSEQSQPGQKEITQAAEDMNQAADEMDGERRAAASEEQQQAVEQLEQSREQLQKALDEAQRQQQEQLLARLEKELRTMHVRQLAVNQSIVDLDGKGAERWTRTDELALNEQAREQGAIADAAEQLEQMLAEDGTTHVLPALLSQVRADMLDAAGYLRNRATGPPTQRLQTTIAELLQEMIELIRQQQRENAANPGEGGGEGGGGAGMKKPLLPGSTELKLLRAGQQRVAAQTRALDQADAANRVRAADVERLSRRQKDLADLARKIERAMQQ